MHMRPGQYAFGVPGDFHTLFLLVNNENHFCDIHKNIIYEAIREISNSISYLFSFFISYNISWITLLHSISSSFFYLLGKLA